MTHLYKSIDTVGDGGGAAGGGYAPAIRPDRLDDRAPTAVVIGTGFGGLAAAIRLSVKGYRVQMLE